MSELNYLKKSITAYVNVLPFVSKNKTHLFYIIPLTLNLILTISMFWAIHFLTDSVTTKISQTLGLDNLEVAGATLEWLISIVLYVVFFFIKIYIYQYISLLIIAPFLSFLTEQVLNSIYGQKKEISWNTFFPLMLRGLKVTLRIFLLQIISTYVLIFICKSVPLLMPFLPVVLFLLNAYCMGFILYDYINEYQELNFKDSIEGVKTKTTLLLGNGVVYQFLLLIPIIGVMFAPVFALVAMCLANREIEIEEKTAVELE